MSKKFHQNEQGIAHVLLAIVVVVVVAAAGFAVWRVANNNSKKSSSQTSSSSKPSGSSNTAAASAAETACLSKYHDSDLCAFVAAEAATPFEKTAAKITLTGTSSGTPSNITLEQDGKGNESFSLTGGGQTINTINFDGQTYTQQTVGGPWITYGSNSSTNTSTSSTPDSTLNSFISSVSTTSYTKIGTEACGNLTCFKYQIKDTTSPNSTQYAWFDTKDHLLRQYYESDPSTGDKMTMAISYQSVSISKPSPVQNLSSQTGQ